MSSWELCEFVTVIPDHSFHLFRRMQVRSVSAHCNTLQHTATHCNTLQHNATHCKTLQHSLHPFWIMHVCVYMYICMYVYTYTCISIYKAPSLCASSNPLPKMHVFTYTYRCIYVHMYICMFIYMCIYIYVRAPSHRASPQGQIRQFFKLLQKTLGSLKWVSFGGKMHESMFLVTSHRASSAPIIKIWYSNERIRGLNIKNRSACIWPWVYIYIYTYIYI